MKGETVRKLRTWLAEQRVCRWAKALVKGPEVSQEKIRSFVEQHKGERLPTRPSGKAWSLAIVVPCYNHAPYLEQAISSILKQTRQPDEVIFVDDRATDGTAQLLQQLIAARETGGGPRFRLLSNQVNLGQAASLNAGIEAATADLIMVLNDDDYLFPYAAAAMVALFTAHPDLFMIGGSSVHFGSDRELAERLKHAEEFEGGGVQLVRRTPDQVVRYKYYNDLNMTNSGCCFWKSAWQAVGGYYPDKERRLVPFSDRDFQLRVNALFPVGVCLELPFAFWRNNSSVDYGINS